MAETVADLQAQLEKLNHARANGARMITYSANGATRTVEYKSDVELQGAQNDLMRRIALLQGLAPRIIKIASSKGLEHEHER